MQWDRKKTAGLLAVSAAIAAVGVAEARRGRADKVNMPEPIRVEQAAPAAAMPMFDPGISDQKIIMYDEVGYAGRYPDELAGQPTASGEPYHPQAYTVAHPSLPLGTFVEITSLDTGKTILARINDVGPSQRGGLVDVSAAIASALGIAGNGPVRVRRVNPPPQEQSALAAGQKGADRLDTPPQLLTALRRKLGAGPISPTPIPAPPVQQAQVPGFEAAQTAQAGDDGFIVEQSGQWTPARAAPPRAAPVKAAKAPTGRPGTTYEAPVVRGGFIVEQAGQRSTAAPARPNGRYYVQLAAFSDEGRARSAAGRAGAGVERAGNVWRVKKGPYADEGQARSALGQVAASGYRDARITR